jgi:lysophospholipase L1-like esterase
MPHVALLGDSIFDNAPYTSGGPAVIDHLRQALPEGWSADLLAIDGAVSGDVSDQLKNLSAEHTHLVLSVGGNDALLRADVLTTPVRLSGEAFILLAQAVDEFAAAYEETIDETLGLGLPLVVCTIYNGNFDPPEYQAAARMALCGFNDVILRVALRRSLPVIELRDVCTTTRDFANPIEPSVEGGAKIARAIVSVLFRAPHLEPHSR